MFCSSGRVMVWACIATSGTEELAIINVRPQQCKRLIPSYHKRLIEVLAASGGTTNYYI